MNGHGYGRRGVIGGAMRTITRVGGRETDRSLTGNRRMRVRNARLRAPLPASGANNSPHEDVPDWLADQPTLLAPYAGQWVAFAGRAIVAHGPVVEEVVCQSRAAGFADPLLVPVPLAETLVN